MLEKLRREFGGEPFTTYDARRVYEASGKFVKEVFGKAQKFSILKPAEKCVPALRFDPDESNNLMCGIDKKPYEVSVCPSIEKLIECKAGKGPDSKYCEGVLKILELPK